MYTPFSSILFYHQQTEDTWTPDIQFSDCKRHHKLHHSSVDSTDVNDQRRQLFGLNGSLFLYHFSQEVQSNTLSSGCGWQATRLRYSFCVDKDVIGNPIARTVMCMCVFTPLNPNLLTRNFFSQYCTLSEKIR